MSEDIKVIGAKHLMLDLLKGGPHSRTELTSRTRHYKPEVRQKAFNDLLAGQFIIGTIKVSCRPGRNPQLFKLTPAGSDELKRLVKEYR